MPPKKDENKPTGEAIAGFNERETKLLAAAFIASIGPDKYDFERFATLTGNTVGSLKKMWPPIKRKAIDTQPSFAVFLEAAPAGTSGGSGAQGASEPKAKTAPKAKANNGKKRKATSESEDDEAAGELHPEATNGDDDKKKVPAKGRGRKKAENADGEEGKKKSAAKGRGRKRVKSEEEVEKESTPESDEAIEDAQEDAVQEEV